ncbi:MAG: EamA family transporter [Candidatus Woesearchaeota archaeon]
MNYVLLTIIGTTLLSIIYIIDKYVISSTSMKPWSFAILVSMLECSIFLAVPFFGLQVPDIRVIVFSLVVGASFILSVAAYGKAMLLDDASRVVPLLQLSPIFVFMLSFIFLGERLALPVILGVFFLIVGAFVISTERTKGVFRLRPALYFAAMNSVVVAAATVCQKYLLSDMPPFDLLVWMRIGSLVPALLLLLVPTIRRDTYSVWQSMRKPKQLVFFSNEALTVIALIVIIQALSIAPASVISALWGFQLVTMFLFTILITVFLPKIISEDLSKKVLLQKGIAIAIMFVGLWLVY